MLKNVKVQTVLVLQYQYQPQSIRNDRKILHPRTKLIASDSGIDEAFKSKHQSIMPINIGLFWVQL